MMQDLVGVRVPDAAEEVRIGQRSLQRVVLRAETLRKGIGRRVEDLEAVRRQCSQRGGTANEMKTRALLAARLGEQERARLLLDRALAGLRCAGGREVERREPDPAGHACAERLPLEASCDHEMDDEMQRVALLRLGREAEDDALAEA